MSDFKAIFLGIIQGLTEYLPVSSSAHLVLIPALLLWDFSKLEAFFFDVLIQLGTLLGLLVYFRKKVIKIAHDVARGLLIGKPFFNENAKLGWLVFYATIPSAIIGLIFKDHISSYFSSPKMTSIFLMCTGVILLLAEGLKPKLEKNINFQIAMFIGLAQSLSLLPGISRSGSTIACGMILGLGRKKSAEFSFFMSIPVMIGASIVAGKDLIEHADVLNKMLTPIVLGFFSAAISGYVVIKWFMNFISNQSLLIFAFYCLIIGFMGSYYFTV